MHPQLALRLLRKPAPSLDNFVAAGNAEVVHALRHLAAGEAVWLCGPAGCGRTHLLLAVADRGDARYVALTADSPPELLDGLAGAPLVALDDVDVALGRRQFELALFRLVNELRTTGGRLLLSAAGPPRGAGAQLADLASRLSRSTVFRLQPLDDAALTELLSTRAGERGLVLPDAVCGWILNRFPRDPATLVAIVDLVDEAAARAGRAPSVPFVRSVLEP